mgnify:FL=1|jgi:hypothetical protein
MAYTDIDDPSVHFQTALYTGNATQRDITNDGNSDLQPDWVWIKCRSAAEANMLYDSTRGVTKDLRSDGTAAENTNAQGLQTFNSNGFQLGTLQNTNFNTKTMVAWQWKANGGTATATISESGNNPAAVVQANPTAGFSIITYTGTGASGTIAHGLGARPKFIIIKNRDAGEGWHINGELLTGNANGGFHFNTDAEYTGGSNNSTASSIDTNNIHVISSGNVNTNAQKYVAYVFAEKQGYSKFGSYVGNSNADGTFVYTGFKPAWIMIKHAGSFGGDQQYASWGIWDNKRATSNVVTQATMLTANNQYQEGNRGNNSSSTLVALDMLSNGFKIRNTSYEVGQSGTYIYMAFAEHPFVSSEGVPTTAR